MWFNLPGRAVRNLPTPPKTRISPTAIGGVSLRSELTKLILCASKAAGAHLFPDRRRGTKNESREVKFDRLQGVPGSDEGQELLMTFMGFNVRNTGMGIVDTSGNHSRLP